MERSAYSVDSHRGGIQLLSLCVRFVVLECVDRNVPSVCLVSVFNCRVATKTLTSLYISMKRPSPWQFFACHMPLIDTRARVLTATGNSGMICDRPEAPVHSCRTPRRGGVTPSPGKSKDVT